jgi:nitronate monooxygenase
LPSPTILRRLRYPIVLAPLAGGPATSALAVAVSEAGGLGFLAAGYRTAQALAGDIREVRGQTPAPFGVNLFVPGRGEPADPGVGEYVERLRGEAADYGVELGEARDDDDEWDAKLEVLHDERVPVVSFTFGCPSADLVASLQDAASEVWVTVTDVAEARIATDAGADALVLQGIEAGGHRGSFVDRDDAEDLSTLVLLRLVSAEIELPLVAAGGITDGASLAAVLVAGAAGAQIGTGFLRAREAGTHPGHRAALATGTSTALTRAFTGRRARGLANRFLVEHSRDAPVAYPHVHHVTAPLRAAARERGDAEGFNLWAGQAHRLAPDATAAEIVRMLARDAQAALDAAVARGRGSPS